VTDPILSRITVPLESVLPGLSPLPWKEELLTGYSRKTTNGVLWANGWNPKLRGRQYLDFDFARHAVNLFPTVAAEYEKSNLLIHQLLNLPNLPDELRVALEKQKNENDIIIAYVKEIPVSAETVIEVKQLP
jgi:hypothetical protein